MLAVFIKSVTDFFFLPHMGDIFYRDKTGGVYLLSNLTMAQRQSFSRQFQAF